MTDLFEFMGELFPLILIVFLTALFRKARQAKKSPPLPKKEETVPPSVKPARSPSSPLQTLITEIQAQVAMEETKPQTVKPPQPAQVQPMQVQPMQPQALEARPLQVRPLPPTALEATALKQTPLKAAPLQARLVKEESPLAAADKDSAEQETSVPPLSKPKEATKGSFLPEFSSGAMTQAVILREILDKPLSRRGGRRT